MQTVVGYWFAEPHHPEEIRASMARVRDHYEPMSPGPMRIDGLIGPSTGLAAMRTDRPSSNWPEWQVRGMVACATVHVPFGWRRVLPNVEIQDGPLELAEHLLADPGRVVDLVPPFAILRLDAASGELSVVNDGLGYVRLYVLHDERQLVVASRLGAIPIFLGMRPSRSLAGWRTSGAAGWFMGDSTPIERVQQLGPGRTIVAAPGRRVSSTQFDAIRHWTAPRDVGGQESASDAVDQLSALAADVGELWDRPPRIQLSGGRDSRAAAAGFVAQRMPAIYHTVATLEGELTIARRLLEAVGLESDHQVLRERDSSMTGEIRERAAALHRAFDGVYGPGGLKQPLKRGFDHPRPTVTGAAGEIARGNFYKYDILPMLRKRGAEGPFRRLDGLYASYGGANAGARQAVSQAIERALESGRERGLDGPALLDYFYFTERLRRWANPSARIGTMTPLASPAYVRAAFDQTPEDKLQETFHVGLIVALVPEWRDIPFYKASAEDARKMTRPRLWATGDREGAIEILDDPSLWDDVFHVGDVRHLWSQVEAGDGGTRHETVLHRLIWRATYEDHLRLLARAAVARPTDREALRPIAGRWNMIVPADGRTTDHGT